MAPTADSTKVKPAIGAQLARNSLWSLGGWIAMICLNFIAAPVTIRQLGIEAYGVLALIVTVIAPLGLFDMGMGEATVKYMAESFGRKAPREAEAYLRSTMCFNLIIGLIGAVTIVALADWMVISMFDLPVRYQAMARTALYLVGLNWAMTQISQTFIGALTALQHYRTISVGTLIIQGGTLLVGITVLLAGGNLLHLVISQSLCAGLAVIGWNLAARAALPGFIFLPRWDKNAFKRSAGMGFWQMVNKIGGLFANRAQYWLLGVMLPIATVGYYNLSYQVVTIVYLISFKVGQVLFPAISHLQGEGRFEEAARRTTKATWLCTTAGQAVLSAVLCLAADFLRLWVGENVAVEASMTLRVLALHNGISMAFAVPNFYLLGTGRARWIAIMAIAQGLLTFSIACVLVSTHGLVGAAWGVLAGSVAHLVILVVLWRRVFRQWISAGEYFSGIFGPIITGLLLGWGFYGIRLLWPNPLQWLGLFVWGGAVTLTAGIVLLLVNGLLPGGNERWAMIRKMGQLLKGRMGQSSVAVSEPIR